MAQPACEEPNDLTLLLSAARQGSNSSLGLALNRYHEYLLLIANQELSEELRPKVGASDLVQESFIEAQRDFRQFHGTTAEEWAAWLRRILLNNLEDQARRYQQRAKRQLSREDAFGSESDTWSNLAADNEPPSGILRRREDSGQLAEQIARLTEPYQQVLRLRYWENQSLDEIGRQMGRSSEAVRKLWFRAVRELSKVMRVSDDSREARQHEEH